MSPVVGDPLRGVIVGVVAVGAVLGALAGTPAFASELLVGTGLLAAAGVLGIVSRTAAALAAVPGSFLVVSGTDVDSGWPSIAAAAAIVSIGAATGDVDRRWRGRRLVPAPSLLLLAAWAAAIALVVPDTEEAIPVAAVLVVCVIVAALVATVAPGSVERLGPVGWWALPGVLVWVSTIGGLGRPGSVVAATGAAGALVAEPVGARLASAVRRRRHPVGSSPSAEWPVATLIVLGAALALVERWIGRFRDVGAASVVVAVTLAVGVGVVAVGFSSGQRPGRRRSVPWTWGTGAIAAMLTLTVALTSPAAAEKGIVYASVGGRELTTRIDRDRDIDEARPAVVLVHGGRWRNGSAGDMGPIADLVVAQGWVAVTPNVRLDEHPGFPSQVDDLDALVRFLRANAADHGIDPARIAFLGVSSGANLGLLSALRSEGPLTAGERVVGVVSLSGPTDLEALAGAGPDLHDAILGYLECEPADCPGLYRAASPITHVTPDDPPVFLANSEEEQIPVGQAISLAAALERAGVDVETSIVPGDRHARSIVDDVWQGAVTFLQPVFGEPVQAPPRPDLRGLYAAAAGSTQRSTTTSSGSSTSTSSQPTERPETKADDRGPRLPIAAANTDDVVEERARAALVAAVVAGAAAVVAIGAATIAVVGRRRTGAAAAAPEAVSEELDVTETE